MNETFGDTLNEPRPVAKPVAKPVEKPLTREDRVTALLDGYKHGLEHNAPRNPVELAELVDLLGAKS